MTVTMTQNRRAIIAPAKTRPVAARTPNREPLQIVSRFDNIELGATAWSVGRPFRPTGYFYSWRQTTTAADGFQLRSER
jgi:hypothetical protein